MKSGIQLLIFSHQMSTEIFQCKCVYRKPEWSTIPYMCHEWFFLWVVWPCKNTFFLFPFDWIMCLSDHLFVQWHPEFTFDISVNIDRTSSLSTLTYTTVGGRVSPLSSGISFFNHLSSDVGRIPLNLSLPIVSDSQIKICKIKTRFIGEMFVNDDGWVCVVEVIGVPSKLIVTRKTASLSRIYIDGCRYNEWQNVKMERSKRLEYTRLCGSK